MVVDEAVEVVVEVVVVVVEYYCFLIIIIVGTPNLLDPVWLWKYKHLKQLNTSTAAG